ncbi:hydantoinase B/oxoprolinase family protein [Mangrovimicrobium sediminis]|uniref:Hydantoinase B/oxoprolinase family protein n=1 Tax=Mangrovimicrobium sediminis TaxID=2562682 RepID=A0A4Z0LW38_9GAMM|nr:hydantoinase B/oxoprolinase family protein [Haliea sp. SAOS-164]TGD71358.1 hydantoinase B/oxoprolinase family protein [Haliea sp. SAOS-164]
MSYELNRKLAARREPLPTSATVDPVTAAIIRGGMETICFEAATYLGRAASSAIINQSNERNGSIVDAHGRLAGAAIGTPHLTFVTGLTVRYGLDRQHDYDWGPGDVFLANDPDYGGGHLPDYNVYAPIYDDAGELIMVQCLQAHQGDTGGKDPGGFTLEATDIYTEGMAFPCLKLVHRGVMRQDVFDMVVRNNRLPEFAGDLAAMIGGVQHSVRLMTDLIRKWGSDKVKAAINYNVEHTEKRVREEVSAWPDGVYEADVYIDHDSIGKHKDIRVHVACKVAGDKLTVDLTGTDDRQELVGVWNTFGNSRGYVMTQVVAMMDPTINKNEGFFNAVEMIIPEGCIAHPPPNKPAALGSFHPACEITEAVCVALSGIVPGRAAPQVYKMGMPNAVIGFDQLGRMWLDQGVDSRTHDSSAVEGMDGWGSCPAALGNLLLSQVEDAEARFPMLNMSREMVQDSEGAGRWRGQPGSLNVKQVLAPTTAMTWMVTVDHPLRGMCGGDDASPYSNRFRVGAPDEVHIDVSANEMLPSGSVIAYQYGGGAGFEPAIMRNPEAVKEDVLDEIVSVERAREKYGVVFTGTVEDFDLAVDIAATQALREQMGGERAA